MAPITVAALYVALGWQTTLAVTGLAGVALALLLVSFLTAPGAVSERPAGAGRRVLLSRALMFVFYVFSSMTSSGVQSFVPTSLVEPYGMPIGGANVALTVCLAALGLGIFLGGILADRVSNHAAIAGGMFAPGTTLMFVLAVAQPPL